MLNENNIGCFFLQLSINENEPYQRYNSLAKCAVNSFQKFHPEVQVFHITNENVYDYLEMIGEEVELYDQIGLVRYILAEKLMRKLGIKKMIILGIDTITCSRLDEFLDDDSVDVLTTLNYPCVESTAYWKTTMVEFVNSDGKKIYDFTNVNADVVCFNNPDALKRVIDLSIEHFSGFGEQGGLNELVHMDKSYTYKTVDFPYHLSKVVYNARSKGVFGTGMNDLTTPQMYFYVQDGKLYTQDRKYIKCWHYIEGLSGQNAYEFKALIDKWKFKLFNEETKKFFKEQCVCSDFFEKEYDIQRDWFGA